MLNCRMWINSNIFETILGPNLGGGEEENMLGLNDILSNGNIIKCYCYHGGGGKGEARTILVGGRTGSGPCDRARSGPPSGFLLLLQRVVVGSGLPCDFLLLQRVVVSSEQELGEAKN